MMTEFSLSTLSVFLWKYFYLLYYYTIFLLLIETSLLVQTTNHTSCNYNEFCAQQQGGLTKKNFTHCQLILNLYTFGSLLNTKQDIQKCLKKAAMWIQEKKKTCQLLFFFQHSELHIYLCSTEHMYHLHRSFSIWWTTLVQCLVRTFKHFDVLNIFPCSPCE